MDGLSYLSDDDDALDWSGDINQSIDPAVSNIQTHGLTFLGHHVRRVHGRRLLLARRHFTWGWWGASAVDTAGYEAVGYESGG